MAGGLSYRLSPRIACAPRLGDALPRWRLQVAHTLAWALWLIGWIGLGSLAHTLAPTSFAAFTGMALWLLALGAGTARAGRTVPPPWLLRGLLLAAPAISAMACLAAPAGGGWAALGIAACGWAGTLALASAVVRACRGALPARPATPVVTAACGALLAWACLGDIGDLQALGLRLAGAVVVAGVVLAGLLPRAAAGAGPANAVGAAGAPAGGQAGPFDCALPAWSSAGWAAPSRWPLLLASLVMLPMMCGLPLMVSLCRSNAVSPQGVLGLHLAAMFVPALLLVRWPGAAVWAPQGCASLLGLGAMALLVAPASTAWWLLVLAHGAAWSVGWSVQLQQRGSVRAAGTASPLAGAAVHAGLVLLLGAGIALAGLQALAAWHAVLGIAGLVAGVVAGPITLVMGHPDRAPWHGLRALPRGEPPR